MTKETKAPVAAEASKRIENCLAYECQDIGSSEFCQHHRNALADFYAKAVGP